MQEIVRAIRNNGINVDYIHTSMKILEEITRRSGGIKLREDNILFMLSTRLKDLCNQYGVFIMSSTQLNATWKEENLLRQIREENNHSGTEELYAVIRLGGSVGEKNYSIVGDNLSHDE